MHSASHPTPDLLVLFEEINQKHFEGFLDPPILHWNSRLRSSAGRFIPGSRKFPRAFPPKIDIASYLIEEKNALDLIKDTLAHEVIHYWLWVRRRPYGHSSEFLSKMKQMGVSRYNPVPRLRPLKYLYQCQTCNKDFPARRKLGPLACADCCKRYADGNYDVRFKLVLARSVNRSSEALES